MQESETDVRDDTKICRCKDSGDATTWEKKKKMKSEADMDSLCQSTAIGTITYEVHDRNGWMRTCVCRSDPIIKLERRGDIMDSETDFLIGYACHIYILLKESWFRAMRNF